MTKLDSFLSACRNSGIINVNSQLTRDRITGGDVYIHAVSFHHQWKCSLYKLKNFSYTLTSSMLTDTEHDFSLKAGNVGIEIER